jgi:hypothetical protein
MARLRQRERAGVLVVQIEITEADTAKLAALGLLTNDKLEDRRAVGAAILAALTAIETS